MSTYHIGPSGRHVQTRYIVEHKYRYWANPGRHIKLDPQADTFKQDRLLNASTDIGPIQADTKLDPPGRHLCFDKHNYRTWANLGRHRIDPSRQTLGLW